MYLLLIERKRVVSITLLYKPPGAAYDHDLETSSLMTGLVHIDDLYLLVTLHVVIMDCCFIDALLMVGNSVNN